MLRKDELENRIRKCAEEMEKIGLQISVLKVLDPNIITELERVSKRGIMKRKPIFISPKNYKGTAGRIEANEYGRIYGIKLVKNI